MIVLLIVAAVFLCVLLKLITAPVRLAWKLVINLFFGVLCLVLFNLIGCAVGFQIGISPFTAAVVAILGLPGALMLLPLQWLL